MNSTWSVRIDRLPTQLCVGTADHERRPQPVWVSLRLRGFTPACPGALDDCIDYEPLCRWITDEWPATPHSALLEQRVNELLCAAFDLDPRIQAVEVELAKLRMRRGAVTVAVERSVSRAEFDVQRRRLAEPAGLQRRPAPATVPATAVATPPGVAASPSTESAQDECLPA